MSVDVTPLPPLDPRRLLSAAPWRVEVVERSASTMLDVAQAAREGADEGLVRVAEHQTAGRGRIDRTFETPPRAALTFSALLRPQVPIARWSWLPLACGLAVHDAVGALHPGVGASLKWPNDVLVEAGGEPGAPGKLCGILLERIETARGAAAVLGIGINAATTREQLPVARAASLATAGVPAEQIDRTGLLLAVLARLEARLRTWRGDDVESLRADYERVCDTLGRLVRVEMPHGEPLRGEAVGLDPAGALIVQAGGRRHVVGAGDVVHVRPGE